MQRELILKATRSIVHTKKNYLQFTVVKKTTQI